MAYGKQHDCVRVLTRVCYALRMEVRKHGNSTGKKNKHRFVGWQSDNTAVDVADKFS